MLSPLWTHPVFVFAPGNAFIFLALSGQFDCLKCNFMKR